MGLRVKFPVVDERVIFGIHGQLGEDALRKHFAGLVRKSIAEIDAANDRAVGQDVKYRTFVDGAESANLESVKFGGAIVARWELGVGVVDYIWDLLQNAGPRKTGRYRASVRLFVDGRETRNPKDAAGAREALFVAGVPYARKIERGKKGYAPGHVYEAVVAHAKARFSNIARIRFTYVPSDIMNEHAARKLRGVVFTAGRKFRTRAQLTAEERYSREYDRLRRMPAIIVYLT